MATIRLDIQYDGTDYSGWQIQKNAPTVQGFIEAALEKVTGRKVAIHGAGRTDAGVHALNQVASFKIDHRLPPEKYKEALNYYLPQSILILSSRAAADDFHARKSARWRRYRYLIATERSALYFRQRWEYPFELSLVRMNEVASLIRGIHDFSAFCVVSSQKENNNCRIISAEWSRPGITLVFDIKADRFLHTMVRSLVGLMVDTGKVRDYLTLEQIKDIIASGDHTRIKTVAPSRGLYLVSVGY